MYDATVEVRDVTLADLLDRVFDQGVVLAGDITISVADVDLISLRLSVLLASVERLAELGMRAASATGSWEPAAGDDDRSGAGGTPRAGQTALRTTN